MKWAKMQVQHGRYYRIQSPTSQESVLGYHATRSYDDAMLLPIYDFMQATADYTKPARAI